MRDEFKDLLKNCKTEEEALQLLQDQKIELDDEELEDLKGGTWISLTLINIGGCCDSNLFN